MMTINKSALELESGAELEKFDLGYVLINHTKYKVLTGYEGIGRCFWCGKELEGKRKRYCRGHMGIYYKHFMWQSASKWALERANYCCQNCGSKVRLEVHHIVPLNGGDRFFSALNLPWNLVTLCHECHVEIHKEVKQLKNSWEDARAKGQEVMELGL